MGGVDERKCANLPVLSDSHGARSLPAIPMPLIALAFGVLIAALAIGGAVWIMDHLNNNVLPMDRMTRMRR